MIAIKLILFCLVGFCFCVNVYDQARELLGDSTPEETIEFLKEILKFSNNQTFTRLWLTEKKTCNEVDEVLLSMKANMETDLGLLLADLKKFLKPQLLIRDKKKRWCFSYLESRIKDTIDEEMGFFTKCIDRSTSILVQDKAEVEKQRKEFVESVKYSVNNLDECLEHSNKKSEEFRKQCVNEMFGDNIKKINKAYEVFSNSTCMSFFKNAILTCTSDVFDRMTEEKKKLQKNYEQCFGIKYNIYDLSSTENLGRSIQAILSNHMVEYEKLNHAYDQTLCGAFTGLYKISKNKGENLETNYNASIKAYYDTLQRTMEENRSQQERECATTAIKQLDQLVVEVTNDSKACVSFALQERGDVVESLKSDLEGFNETLSEAGNVALLRCIRERPQKIFGSRTIETCAKLAWDNISWDCTLVGRKVMKTLKKAMQTNPEMMPDGKTCGAMRERRLQLDAEKVMYDCTRCLFGVSGDYYAVTTPRTVTTTEAAPWPVDYYTPGPDDEEYATDDGSSEFSDESTEKYNPDSDEMYYYSIIDNIN